LNLSTAKYLIIITIGLIFYSCKNDPLDIDVSSVDVTLNVKRFDQQLFGYEKITDKEVDELAKKYNPFYTAFIENIVSIGNVNDPSVYYYLNNFTHDKNIKSVQKDIDNLYNDFNDYEIGLKEAFQHYKLYFPNKNIPQIIAYNSGFNYAVVTDSSYLGIGLEMFLGDKYPAYKQLGLPQYKIASMTNKHLVSSVMLGWISTEFELEQANADLLTEMVHQGKLLYVLDALIPTEEDSIKINYTNKEVKWSNANEKQVWFYFIDNDLLYTKETKEIIKYMGEAPFIQGFPEGSPGRIGHWIGWQIVKAYMDNNQELSLTDLIKEKDAQKILNKSKYKP
jgi:hypothetical protein